MSLEEVKKWACEKISSIIGISSEECRPLIDNIWELQTENEIRTEFQNIIGNSVSTNLFINDFVSRRNLNSNSNNNSSVNLDSDVRNNSPYEYYKNDAEEYYSGSKKKKKDKKQNETSKKDKGKKKNDDEKQNVDNTDDTDDEEKEVKLSKRQQKKLNAKKKKGGISLEEWDKEDRSFVTKGKNGRPLCPCQAAKHGLVANCLNCGKIVCKLEGPGPCPFCGEEVLDSDQQVRVYQQKQREKLREEKTILIKSTNNNNKDGSNSSNSKANASSSSSSPLRPSQEQIDQQRSEKLAIKLEVQMEMDKREKAYEKAIMMKERLLDYDKNSTERTKIFDTATDFDPNMTAANNKWLTPEERLAAIKKEQALREYEKNKRKNVRIAIDIKTKQVVELPADPFEYKEDEPITAISESKEQEEEVKSTGYYINPFIKEIPKYVKVNIYDKQKQEKEKPKSILEKKTEQKEKEKAAREKAKKEAAKKDNQIDEKTSTSKNEKKINSKKSGKSRIRRIQYDPEDDDMYGVDFAFSDDEEETEDAGVCSSSDNVLGPSVIVDY
ncbi:hypothetical protein BCR36DRAFT_409995 [Piromyces finnis]|uniref:Uncharacterized protein n=1 Tax=Piromyces finnis TaxID=1754191 RepID=A0A1Y1VGV5_9FUNG|nr:hypothetical protein BCR36DRAFT_409995 [Piromyces finnis]|eukprot:ORX55956.1 hypothetical protein BCR36DRAFT_409995 [Piromyces finnis]